MHVSYTLILEIVVANSGEKIISIYGNGAKVDAPKRYLGERAYVVIVKN
ncbi:MAG: hypothetical protein DRO76_05915 [Candidatus Altiarchaeales archaeon]|nr:MAG: hypothetical protein DRO76_05915 [Candidatus Altiarchaeales archaeon]